MRISHSSVLTLLAKATLPPLYVGLWALAVVDAGAEDTWLVVLLGGLGFAPTVWLAAGLAQVESVGRNLVLTGFLTHAVVPFTQVERVTRWWWSRPGLVTVVLRAPTPFGRCVSFVPPMSPLHFVGLGWLDDSAVRELRDRVRTRGAVEGPQDGAGDLQGRGAHPANQRRSAP